MNINAMEVLSAKERITKLLWAKFYLCTLDFFFIDLKVNLCASKR